MNIEKAIRTAVDTGKVVFGEKETLSAVKSKEVRLVIVAGNCPAGPKAGLKKAAGFSGIPTYEYATSLELGSVCGRHHLVSMLGVSEAGDSDIFELGRR